MNAMIENVKITNRLLTCLNKSTCFWNCEFITSPHIEYDNRISEMSEDQLKEILEQVRKLRSNKKKKDQQKQEQEQEEVTDSKAEEEISVTTE